MKKKTLSAYSYISSVLVLLCINVRIETPAAREARKKKKRNHTRVYLGAW